MNNVIVNGESGETFKIGDLVLVYDEGINFPAMVCLVSTGHIEVIILDEGNRWNDEVPVKDIMKITTSEILNATSGHPVTKIGSVTITTEG